MIYFILVILGLLLGSFYNALIYRLYKGESIVRGRSHCPHCGHTLSWRDLFPIFSWLWLGGHCRYCQAKIGWQYPMIELVSAGLLVMGYAVLGPAQPLLNFTTWLPFIYYAIASAGLLIIFIFDGRYTLIPDKVSLPLMVVALLFTWLTGQDLVQHILAGVVGLAWFGWQYVISRGRWIGGGDLRMGLLMGLLLGWPGIVIALFISYILGAVVAIGLLLSHRRQIGSQLAFGTFLSVAALLTWLWGDQLLHWYLNLFI
ncbi:MAG: prepilin peptidase [Candidatus Komeilibacteria bacterium]